MSGRIILFEHRSSVRFPENIAQFRTEHPDVTREVYGDHGEHHAGLNLADIYLDLKKVPCRKTNKSLSEEDQQNMNLMQAQQNMMQVLFKNLGGSGLPGIPKKMQAALKEYEDSPEITVLPGTRAKKGVVSFLSGSSVGRLALTDGRGSTSSSLPDSTPGSASGVDVGALQLPDVGDLQLPSPKEAEATHLLAQHRFGSYSVIGCAYSLRSFIGKIVVLLYRVSTHNQEEHNHQQ